MHDYPVFQGVVLYARLANHPSQMEWTNYCQEDRRPIKPSNLLQLASNVHHTE